MSVVVDTEKIRENINNIDNYIKEYSENSFNIFFELSKLDNCWIGSKKKTFDDKIQRQKNNNIVINTELTNISNFYKKVENLYIKYKNEDNEND